MIHPTAITATVSHTSEATYSLKKGYQVYFFTPTEAGVIVAYVDQYDSWDMEYDTKEARELYRMLRNGGYREA